MHIHPVSGEIEKLKFNLSDRNSKIKKTNNQTKMVLEAGIPEQLRITPPFIDVVTSGSKNDQERPRKKCQKLEQ